MSDRGLVSPGKRPMILVRRRTSTKVRSSRFVDLGAPEVPEEVVDRLAVLPGR
jgi:hypothetical protein